MRQARFDDAMTLIESIEFQSIDEKMASINGIKAFQAHHLFTQEKRYQAALDLLQAIDASPHDVIDLFVQFRLLDPEATFSEPGIDFISEKIILNTAERAAMDALASYLSTQRASRRCANQNPDVDLNDLELIDTYLLAIYMKLYPTLAQALLRVTNYCNVETSEQLLKDVGPPPFVQFL